MKKTTILFLLSLALVMVFASRTQTAMLFELDFGQNGTFEDYWEMQPNDVIEVDIYTSNIPSPGLLSIGMDLVYNPLQLKVTPESTVDMANWDVAPQITFGEGEVEMKGGRLLPGLEGDKIKLATLKLKCINPGLSELWIYDSDRQGSDDDFILSDGTVLDGELEGGILVANVNNAVIMHVDAGWSMISLPVVPESLILSDVFPEAVAVYRYQKGTGYVRVEAGENLEVGMGYWILLDNPQSFVIKGTEITEYTMPVEDGWYMIGGCSMPAQKMVSTGKIDVIYGYTQVLVYTRLLASEPLELGKGYWILFSNTSEGAEFTASTSASRMFHLSMFHVKLHIVVVGDDSASSVFPAGYSLSTIENLINDLNGLVSHAGLYFEFNPTTDFEEIKSTEINTDEPMHMERERLSRKHPDKITLIFRDHFSNGLGPNYSGGGSYNATLMKETMVLPVKLAHELGHYLHLPHTFPFEPLIQEVIEDIRKYVEDEGHPIEEGLDALKEKYDNDYRTVGDTPYDLGAKIFGSFNQACANNAKIDLQVHFHSGQNKNYTYAPTMRSNFMSYFGGCGFPHNFSDDQIEVMHKGLIAGNRIRLLQGSEWDSSNAQDFVSPVAVSRHSDTVALFASNKEGALMTKVWDKSRGSYWPTNQGEWFSLGGSGLIAPVAISRRPDLIDLFTRSITGGIVNKVWSEASSAYWPSNTGWPHAINEPTEEQKRDRLEAEKFPRFPIDSKVSIISRTPELLEIFARSADGSIEMSSWTKDWSRWINLGGEGVGAPATIARRPDIIDLYVRWSDGSIRSKVWSDKKNSWYPGKTKWIFLGGKGYDSPAVVARRPEKIDLFIRWDDGSIRSKVWDDSRGSYWPSNETWFNLGGEMTSEPVAVCRNPESIVLFGRWIDGTIRIKVWDDSRGSWWPNNHTDWSNLGGDTIGRPYAVARNENRVIVYARWTDNSIRTKVWNGETSEWWPSQTGWFSLGTP